MSIEEAKKINSVKSPEEQINKIYIDILRFRISDILVKFNMSQYSTLDSREENGKKLKQLQTMRTEKELLEFIEDNDIEIFKDDLEEYRERAELVWDKEKLQIN